MVMRGPEAQGRPLLRPVRARVRDPRDARPAAAHVPDPHVHEAKFDRHHRLGRPCLYAHIEKCAAPCVGDIDHDEYDKLVAGAARLPRRRARRGHRSGSSSAMHEAVRRSSSSSSRRGCATSSRACARRSSASRWWRPREEDFDLIGLAEDPLEASVQVFYVRKGRVVGRKGLIVDKVEDVETPALVARLVEQLYADAPPRRRPEGDPRPGRARGPRALRGVPRAATAASKVRIRVPQRGGKRELLADRDAQRARVVRAAQAAPRVRPQRARARPRRAAGGARPARGAAAHRVLRHLEPPGHRDRRRRWS